MTALLQSASSGSGNDRAGLFSAAIAAGTSAEIVVTWSGGQGRCGIAFWSVYGAAATVSDTLTSLANPMTGTIDCPAGGVIIAYMFSPAGGGGRTITWVGVTEKFDETVDTEVIHSGASDVFADAQSSLTVSATASASLARQVMLVISFGKD